jgi:MFS transporter, putative metabolite:H+ symporter
VAAPVFVFVGRERTAMIQHPLAKSLNGVNFHNPGAFWFGAVATTVGVLLHLPMYLSGASMGYRLAGMPVDTAMLIGMFLIVVGLVSTFYGLVPPSGGGDGGADSRARAR